MEIPRTRRGIYGLLSYLTPIERLINHVSVYQFSDCRQIATREV